MACRVGGPGLAESGAEEYKQTGRERDNLMRRPTKHLVMKPCHPHQEFEFKPFTKESLNKIHRRKLLARKKSVTTNSNKIELDRAEQVAQPDPFLVSGQQIPPAFVRQLPKELIGSPIEDIDSYYADKEVSSMTEIAICLKPQI